MSLRAEWKYVSTEHGEQCVITTGILWMAMSSANSWDFNLQVLDNQFASSCIICCINCYQAQTKNSYISGSKHRLTLAQ